MPPFPSYDADDYNIIVYKSNYCPLMAISLSDVISHVTQQSSEEFFLAPSSYRSPDNYICYLIMVTEQHQTHGQVLSKDLGFS